MTSHCDSLASVSAPYSPKSQVIEGGTLTLAPLPKVASGFLAPAPKNTEAAFVRVSESPEPFVADKESPWFDWLGTVPIQPDGSCKLHSLIESDTRALRFEIIADEFGLAGPTYWIPGNSEVLIETAPTTSSIELDMWITGVEDWGQISVEIKDAIGSTHIGTYLGAGEGEGRTLWGFWNLAAGEGHISVGVTRDWHNTESVPWGTCAVLPGPNPTFASPYECDRFLTTDLFLQHWDWVRDGLPLVTVEDQNGLRLYPVFPLAPDHWRCLSTAAVGHFDLQLGFAPGKIRVPATGDATIYDLDAKGAQATGAK